jgi:hypothetical protein
MYSAGVFYDPDVFHAISETAKKSPGLMATAFKRQTGRLRTSLERFLKTPPPDLPVLPFVWSLYPAANARARRWYFANKVPPGSAGGRYDRTGELLDAWKVVINITDNGGIITASNDADGFDWVIGNRQVPSHTRTGWYIADEVLLDASEQATDILIDTWYTVADPLAGV